MGEGSASPRRSRDWPVAIGALAAVVVLVLGLVAAFALLGSDGAGDGTRHGKPTHGDGTDVVRAAVGATRAAGSYDFTYQTQSTPAPSTCTSVTTVITTPDGATYRGMGICRDDSSARGFATSGHGTVTFAPYAQLIANQTPTTLLYVDTDQVWSGGLQTLPLDQFTSTVAATLGPGQGAVAMMGLASQGGYLDLEQEAISSATSAGTGDVDGHPVTYYDVTIDIAALAQAGGLTDAEQATMAAALVKLHDAGYRGTQERVGVDDDGYIREVTVTTRFADGSSSTRHSVLSNFGCTARIVPPAGGAPPTVETQPCPPPPAATTTTAPAGSTTTSAPTTTTTSPSTSTSTSTSTPTTVAPTTSTGPAPVSSP